MAPKTPNALPRSFGSVNVVVSSDIAAGVSSAAHAPCRARPANSMPGAVAAPPTKEARPKPATPATNTRLRPRRSAIRPPRRSSPP